MINTHTRVFAALSALLALHHPALDQCQAAILLKVSVL